jgi:hypothetical protein
VKALMAKVGARGHVTFGGRLAPDAQGFPARPMARKQSGAPRGWCGRAGQQGTGARELLVAGPQRAGRCRGSAAPPVAWDQWP